MLTALTIKKNIGRFQTEAMQSAPGKCFLEETLFITCYNRNLLTHLHIANCYVVFHSSLRLQNSIF